MTPSIARRIGLGALLFAVAATAAACGGSRSLTDNFTSRITAGDFQVSGSATGSFSVSAGGMTFDGTAAGTFKAKGKDSASSLSMTIAGSTSTNDSVDVGDFSYTRTDGGAWTRSARTTDSGMDFAVMVSAGVTDKGVETHNGKQLHHLEPNQAVDPKQIFGSDSAMSGGTFTVVFWATDDGTPAGLTVSGNWSQDMNGTTAQATITLDFNFDSLSGVTIEAPSM